jgi:hypothetical protein
MADKGMIRIVVDIPEKIYFELREKAGDLTVRQYVELLLRNVKRLGEQRSESL